MRCYEEGKEGWDVICQCDLNLEIVYSELAFGTMTSWRPLLNECMISGGVGEKLWLCSGARLWLITSFWYRHSHSQCKRPLALETTLRRTMDGYKLSSARPSASFVVISAARLWDALVGKG